MIDYAKSKYSPKFYFYTGDNIIGLSIRMYGEYTETEIDLLKHFINKESVVYDIGGNIGVHTVAFAHYAKEVHSFEPNNKNYTLLEKNTAGLTNVKLYQTAVSDVVGDAFISDYDPEGQGNFGECMMSDVGQPCKTIRIDDLALPSPHIIKIDVEGHELKVFNGAKETIRVSRPVIFYESMHGTGFDLIYDFLHDELGYDIYWAPSANYNPNNYNQNPFNIFGNGGVINCLAVPKEVGTVSGLPTMNSRDDTYAKSIERYIKEMQEQK
jgi:FkbM family methyltransferase